ncbi:MAG: aminotransferase class III-fold pyridoxal phosphate-dependent enzyme [Gammaproteobacteria bacterium]|nr:aminotransferase class III-fold pyridoxal phosphate-dependent enzyme [Gammaproteobacteria bacterium]
MDYRDYVRPKYVELMQALGLTRQFHRARCSKLYYRDAQGQEQAVTDFLGGYGAALFGHNDPEFVEAMCQMLGEGVPFNAQMSVRGAAGELARELSAALNAELGSSERYITTFSNSGAEAVEIAVKHAEFRRQKCLQECFDAIDVELAALSSGDAAYEELEFAGLDLPAGLLPDSQAYGTLRQLAEALRQHNQALCQSEPVFVALRKSFHGKLVNTVQLTHGKQYRKPFSRFGLRVEFLDPEQPEQLEALKARHRREWLGLRRQDGRLELRREAFSGIAALLMEPIQGEGGINEFPGEFHLALRRFCNELACPLIIDEIQSGFGRTGSLLASSRYGIQGDYYCLSKALGGGLAKIAATLIRSSHYETDFSYIHSSTFAEDDASCRIALLALRRLQAQDGALLRDIRSKGSYLKAALEDLQQAYPQVIKAVRGQGLLLGIELHDVSASPSMVQASAQYNEALGYLIAGYLLQHEALRVAPSGSNANVLRLEPPATISLAEIDTLITALGRVCDFLQRGDALPLAAGVLADLAPELAPRQTDFRGADAPVPAEGRVVAKVAFINHLIDTDMLSEVDPSLAPLSAAQKQEFVTRMKPERRAVPIGPARIRSALGRAVDFTLYPLCMDSQAMAAYLASGELEPIRKEIAERIRDARADGYRVAGLGMYTSIVTNNGQALDIPDMALTSGNALTIGMGLEAIEQACAQQGLNLAEQTAAIVGAAGNIASTYASLLSAKVDRLLLVGSGREGSLRRLERTAHQIYADAARTIAQGRAAGDRLATRLMERPETAALLAREADAPDLGKRLYALVADLLGDKAWVLLSDELAELKRARIVVCAANAPEAFLGGEHFGSGSVVCDIAVPLNVRAEVAAQRPDLVYLLGGIVQTPLGDGLAPTVRAYLGADQLYACMAESVLMGLSETKSHFSYGDISREQVQQIRALAAAHGFRLAQFKTCNSL